MFASLVLITASRKWRPMTRAAKLALCPDARTQNAVADHVVWATQGTRRSMARWTMKLRSRRHRRLSLDRRTPWGEAMRLYGYVLGINRFSRTPKQVSRPASPTLFERLLFWTPTGQLWVAARLGCLVLFRTFCLWNTWRHQALLCRTTICCKRRRWYRAWQCANKQRRLFEWFRRVSSAARGR